MIQLSMSDTTGASSSRKLFRRYGAASKMRRAARKAALAKAGPKAKQARKNPVDAWPGALMFFFRTTGLLRGLCSALGVEQRYLSIMAKAAERALRERYMEPLRNPPPLLWAGEDASRCGSSLERKLGQMLEELHASGDLVVR